MRVIKQFVRGIPNIVASARREIVGALVAGIILWAVPPTAKGLAGATLSMPLWIIAIGVGATLIVVLLIRAIVATRRLIRRIGTMESQLDAISTETRMLSTFVTLAAATTLSEGPHRQTEIAHEGAGYKRAADRAAALKSLLSIAGGRASETDFKEHLVASRPLHVAGRYSPELDEHLPTNKQHTRPPPRRRLSQGHRDGTADRSRRTGDWPGGHGRRD